MRERILKKRNLKRLLSVVLALLMVISLLPMNNSNNTVVAYAADAGDLFIYVPAYNSDGKTTSEVSKVNVTTGTVEKTIEVGNTSLSVVEDADGFIYVSNGNSHDISVIDPSTDEVIKTITINDAKYLKGITIDPAMKNLYIGVQNSGSGGLYSYNLETEEQKVLINCWSSIDYCTVTEDFVYTLYTPTLSYGKKVCAKYSIKDNTVETLDIPLGARYGNLSPDGSKYVITTTNDSSTNNASIIIVDTATLEISKEITLSKEDAYWNYGMYVDYSKDGKYIYELSQMRKDGKDTGRLYIFDANTYEEKSRLNFDVGMVSAGVGKDENTLLFLTNAYSGSYYIRVVDISDVSNPTSAGEIQLTTKGNVIGSLTPSSYTQAKVKAAKHQHNFTYSSAEGGKIEAYCTSAEGGENCSHYATSYDEAKTNNKLAILTLTAEAITYSETPVEPTITFGTSDEQTAWTGAGIKLPGSGETAPKVTKIYYKADASGNKTGAALGTTPTDVGKYVVEVNVTEGEGGEGKKASVALPYEITKASQVAPTADKFDVTSTSDTVSVAPKSGDTMEYEYSIDNGTTWVSSGAFTGLTDATKYTVSVRVKETATHSASPALTIDKYTTAKTPASASEGATVDNETETITIIDGYEVSTTDTFTTTIANGATVDPNTTYYVRKKGNGELYDPSGAVTFTTPERAATPATPVVESKTDTSIKITPVDGVEYSIDGGATWNTTGEFTGLTANTEYTITARVKATTDKFASEKVTLNVTTKKSAPATPTEEAFTVTSTDSSVTIVKADEGDANVYEYSIDNGETWVNSGEFTGLNPATKYDIKVRIKGTDDTMPSAPLTISKYTKAKTPASASEGVTVNNDTETVTVVEGYEVSTSPDFEEGTIVNNGGAVTPNTTYYVRMKGEEGHFEPSAAISFTTPERAATPATPVVKSKTDVSIQIEVVPGVEYSIDDGATWNTTGKFEDLTANTDYTVKARVKATADKFASEIVTLNVTTKNSAPAAPTGLTGVKPSYIDNNDGKITGVDTTMEYSLDGGETWIAVTGTEITGLVAGDVKVRIKETDTTVAGTPVTITVPAGTEKAPSPAAPTDITGDKPSLVGGTDGKITGVDSTMEYSTDGGETWTAVTGTEITGLSAGDVQVRVKETEKVKAGTPVTVTVPAGTEKAEGPAAPTELKVVNPSTAGGKDGKITGVDSTMEYSTDGGNTWTAVTGTEITGLSAGNVQVRVKETETTKAGTSVTLTIADGTVKVAEDNQKGNFEAGGIKNTVEEVKAAVLTTEDKAIIAAGKDIQVWVEVKDQTKTVSKEDTTKVEAKLEKNFTVGTYLDVTLWKQITGEDANKVTNVPNGKVKIGFTVPKDLQKANRTYKIIRVHDGVAEIIDATVDENFALTFETDRFSTYALVYTDADKAETETTAAKTGDSNNMPLLFVLMLASLGVMIVADNKRKTYR